MEKRFHKGIEGKVVTHPERLEIPLKRRKPTVYAVWNDLFHESVPFEFIKEVHFQIGIMDLHQYGHTFLILTKRPQRILERTFWEDACTLPDGSHDYSSGTEPMHNLLARPKNLWSGLTVCNQQEADEKIPIFLQVPGKKFLSIEPMLGPVDISRYLRGDCAEICPEGSDCSECCEPRMKSLGPVQIDAVILGGETGPGARPAHPDWFRSVRDQCARAGVPFFFKQWGEWVPGESKDFGKFKEDTSTAQYMIRIGRKKAGRLLDGKEYNDLPWRTP
jgi:protein gp37